MDKAVLHVRQIVEASPWVINVEIPEDIPKLASHLSEKLVFTHLEVLIKELKSGGASGEFVPFKLTLVIVRDASLTIDFDGIQRLANWLLNHLTAELVAKLVSDLQG